MISYDFDIDEAADVELLGPEHGHPDAVVVRLGSNDRHRHDRMRSTSETTED